MHVMVGSTNGAPAGVTALLGVTTSAMATTATNGRSIFSTAVVLRGAADSLTGYMEFVSRIKSSLLERPSRA